MEEAINEAEKLDIPNKDRELEVMFQAGIQFGYSRSRRHPSMSDFIHGVKNNIEIFDLEKTKEALEEAEKLKIAREIKTLEEKFSGIENLKNDVGAMIIVDPKEEKTAFSEARRVSLPVIAILSSDNDLSKVAYPIPGNDSASSSLEYLLGKLAKAYQEGVSKSNLNSNV